MLGKQCGKFFGPRRFGVEDAEVGDLKVVSVLWPVRRPSLTTTVLTAPIAAAPGASASSSGTTASL